MSYDAKKAWEKIYLSANEMSYPAEYLIRIFKGKYPLLDFDKSQYKDQKVLDLGCGKGKNLPFLKKCGFDVYGVEITEEIAKKVKSDLNQLGLENIDVRAGMNDSIPFENNFFDYLVSWNSCYYMQESTNFGQHIKEFNRVLKKGRHLILSIPKKTCFIYHGSEELKKGYQIIRNDPFNARNGAIMRMFENKQEIEDVFSKYFSDFAFASVQDDCFGYDYHWHLVVCKKI
ncbi:MAG TPA: class I SAM-dependent methyltransferase [Nitrospinota bacterium]|jgi:ubiquinone/menaquinone biosynthesis C-methylase UbiE|nr:class I SAM-dependent methyltransferase [Nitrospinota bacterium]|tara:strand:+ start:5748 stop:6437 length:690 start_codon:yes stop_codon:yes gene_type:complete